MIENLSLCMVSVDRRKNMAHHKPGGRGQPNTGYQDSSPNSYHSNNPYYHRNGGPSYRNNGGYEDRGGGYPDNTSVSGYGANGAYRSGTAPPNPPHYYK